MELAVLGEIRKDDDGYRLNLWLLDVATGDTLYSDGLVYRSTEELILDCDRLAEELYTALAFGYMMSTGYRTVLKFTASTIMGRR